MLNFAEGFRRKDDTVPSRWLEETLKENEGRELPLKDSRGKVLTAGDVEKLLEDYYDEGGWDKGNRIPTKKKLEQLGLFSIRKGSYPN